MSDSLIVTIDTIKKLTYLTKDQQQELYEELVSDVPLSETFLVHGEISADQYMKNLTSQEQQQISTELGSDDLSERIQQSIARILSVGNEVEEIVYEEWGNDEWSEEWSGDNDDIITNDELDQDDVEREDQEEDDEERTEGKKNAEIEENRGDSELDSESDSEDEDSTDDDLFIYIEDDEDKWFDEWDLLEEETEGISVILCVYSTQYRIFIVDIDGNDIDSLQRSTGKKEFPQGSCSSSEYERLVKESQKTSVDLSLTDDEIQKIVALAKKNNRNISLIVECSYICPAQIQYTERIQRGRQHITKNIATEDVFPLVLRLNMEWNDIGREVKQHQFRKVQQSHQRTILYKLKFHAIGDTDKTNIRIVGEQEHKIQYSIKIRPFQQEKVFVQSNWRLQMNSSDMIPSSQKFYRSDSPSSKTEEHKMSCQRSFIQEVRPQIRQTPSIDRKEEHVVAERFLFEKTFELDNSTRAHTSRFSFASQIRIETEQNQSRVFVESAFCLQSLVFLRIQIGKDIEHVTLQPQFPNLLDSTDVHTKSISTDLLKNSSNTGFLEDVQTSEVIEERKVKLFIPTTDK